MAAASIVGERGIYELLPPEILEKIFSLCNVTDLCKSANVCQRWRDVICQRMTEFNIELRHVDDVNDLFTLLSRAEVLKLRVVWKIGSGVNWDSAPLDALDGSINTLNRQINAAKESKARFRCVTVIHAVICHGDHVRELRTLLARVDGVTELNIEECLNLVNQRGANQRGYHEHDRPVPFGESLSNVTSLCHLKSFEYNVDRYELYPLLDAFLALILRTGTHTLTEFIVYVLGCSLGDIGKKVLQVVEACPQLTHLALDRSNLEEEDRVRCSEIIPTLTHLQFLSIMEDDPSLISLSYIANLKRSCMNLSCIEIGRLALGAKDDWRLLQFVSLIRNLDVSHLDTGQLWLLVSQLRKCCDLSVITVDVMECASHITDDILLSLLQPMRGVTDLFAARCQRLTNEGVVSIIESADKLEDITVCDVHNVSDDLIQLLNDVKVTRDVTVEAARTTLSDQVAATHGGTTKTINVGRIRIIP